MLEPYVVVTHIWSGSNKRLQVCQDKPAFNDGHRSFPTCGKTCARLLEEAQQAGPEAKLPPNSSHSRMGNPNRGGSSSSSRGIGINSSSVDVTLGPMKMCEVCFICIFYQTCLKWLYRYATSDLHTRKAAKCTPHVDSPALRSFRIRRPILFQCVM